MAFSGTAIPLTLTFYMRFSGRVKLERLVAGCIFKHNSGRPFFLSESRLQKLAVSTSTTAKKVFNATDGWFYFPRDINNYYCIY